MDALSDSAWRPAVELAVMPQPAAAGAAPAAADGDGDDGFRIFGEDGFTFLDFLDIINPLHHIPVVGTLYRHFSGDEIDPGPRVFGGTLFFGPLGTVASIGDVLIRDATGKDLGQHVMAFFNDDDAPRPPQVAEATGTVVADVGAQPLNSAAAVEPAEALDPVTAWAMEETAYHQAMASKMQSSNEAKPEVRERAEAPLPAVAAAYADSRKALFAAGLAQPQPEPRMPARLMADSVGTKAAQSLVRHTRQSAAIYAAAGYGQGTARKRDETDADRAAAQIGTPPGAVAPLGGWFKDAMLTAHEKYQAGAVNAGNRLPSTLDVTQ